MSDMAYHGVDHGKSDNVSEPSLLWEHRPTAGIKYRLVLKDASVASGLAPTLIMEKCNENDALDNEIWLKITEVPVELVKEFAGIVTGNEQLPKLVKFNGQ